MLAHILDRRQLRGQVVIGARGLWHPSVGDHAAAPEPCAETHRQVTAAQRRREGRAIIVQESVQDRQAQRHRRPTDRAAQQETAPRGALNQLVVDHFRGGHPLTPCFFARGAFAVTVRGRASSPGSRAMLRISAEKLWPLPRKPLVRRAMSVASVAAGLRPWA